MEQLQEILNQIDGWVWSPVLVALLFGTGLYLTLGLRFMPLYRLPAAIGLMFARTKDEDKSEGEISPVAALFTALSATIGTGNIAGVATAITIGGPGAVFWMWMTAVFGMATKYAEAALAVTYREVDKRGVHVGGPMYYIKNGLGKRWIWLAFAFAIFTAIAAPGTGNLVQANSVAALVDSNLNLSAIGLPETFTLFDSAEPLRTTKYVVGVVLALLVMMVILGGVRSIARVASVLVPFMALAYVAGAVWVLSANASDVPTAFASIFTQAFSGTAAVGGFFGAAFAAAIREGANRGSFSNEAGLGSAAIAHASAQTRNPHRQGSIAMLGTFIDTLVVCTLTALVILTAAGSFTYNPARAALGQCWEQGRLAESEIPGGLSYEALQIGAPQTDLTPADRAADVAERGNAVRGALEICQANGFAVPDIAFAAATDHTVVAETERVWASGIASAADVTAQAFGASIPGGQWIVTFGMMVFAFTTILGWALYGERAMEFIFGVWVITPYRIFWGIVVFTGAVWTNDLAWTAASIGNGMMAAPNLIALLALSGTVFAIAKRHGARPGDEGDHKIHEHATPMPAPSASGEADGGEDGGEAPEGEPDR
ncbi:sodium:alanine symporter family protein [Marinicauda salina]|uniref:Sodium:alanine symporter family protein n=1 Tax=Marinicauda salina TaxID=2135793 RepID=A0A2U2BVY8_9PROT|nr:sodium:alanine symporter family protein [Marinicauda salina]PWE18157.1 sodium:alanine symporter family protein [Marinicauda salina]